MKNSGLEFGNPTHLTYWMSCMYVRTKGEKQLWCISCLHVSLIGQIENGVSTVDKVNSILLGLFFSQ